MKVFVIIFVAMMCRRRKGGRGTLRRMAMRTSMRMSMRTTAIMSDGDGDCGGDCGGDDDGNDDADAKSDVDAAGGNVVLNGKDDGYNHHDARAAESQVVVKAADRSDHGAMVLLSVARKREVCDGDAL